MPVPHNKIPSDLLAAKRKLETKPLKGNLQDDKREKPHKTDWHKG